MKLWPTLFALLLSFPCFAETLGFDLPGALSIDQAREVLVEQADLRISERRIDAPFGIRREEQPAFQPSAPVMLGERYLVRDAGGTAFTLRIRNVIDGRMWVDLEPTGREHHARQAVSPGHFRVTQYSVDGVALTVAFPELVLRDGQRFQFGGASGTYVQQDQALKLDGHYAQWGDAEVDEGGDRVTFYFQRGSQQVEVVLDRVKEGAGSLAASR